MFHINSRLLTQFYHKIFQPDQLTELIIESNRKVLQDKQSLSNKYIRCSAFDLQFENIFRSVFML